MKYLIIPLALCLATAALAKDNKLKTPSQNSQAVKLGKLDSLKSSSSEISSQSLKIDSSTKSGGKFNPTLAMAGQDRGGGGGICSKGNCLTMAELGVRIDPQSAAYRIEPEVLLELAQITAKLPMYGSDIHHLAKYQGSVDQPILVRVDKISDSVMKKIKNEYKEVLKQSGYEDHQKNLTIFAASLCMDERCTWMKTYLLPEFFQLSARQQALTLVHELMVRRTKNFLSALEVDRAILDLLDPAMSPVKPMAVINHYFRDRIGRDAGNGFRENQAYRDESDLMMVAMKFFEQRVGRALELEDFVGANDISVLARGYDWEEFKNVIETDPERFITTTKIFPEFRDIFGMARAELAGVSGGGFPDVGLAPEVKRALTKACATASGPGVHVAIPMHSSIGTRYADWDFNSEIAFMSCEQSSDGDRSTVVAKFNDLFLLLR